MFGFGAPSQLEVLKAEAVKTQLIRELQTSINEVHSLAVITDGALQQSDIVNQLLYVFEAIFLHESKDYLSCKNFWPFLKSNLLHKDELERLRKLNFVNTDIGRCRAWIRIALGDHLFESYLRCICDDVSSVERCYRRTALLRDAEQMKILVTLAQGLSEVQFNLALNSALLNKWPPQPLQLCGIIATNANASGSAAVGAVSAGVVRPNAVSGRFDLQSRNGNTQWLQPDTTSSATLTRVVAVESATDASALASSLLVDSVLAQAARANNTHLDTEDILSSILDSPRNRPSSPVCAEELESHSEAAKRNDNLSESPIAVTVPRRLHIAVAVEALDLVEHLESESSTTALPVAGPSELSSDTHLPLADSVVTPETSKSSQNVAQLPSNVQDNLFNNAFVPIADDQTLSDDGLNDLNSATGYISSGSDNDNDNATVDNVSIDVNIDTKETRATTDDDSQQQDPFEFEQTPTLPLSVTFAENPCDANSPIDSQLAEGMSSGMDGEDSIRKVYSGDNEHDGMNEIDSEEERSESLQLAETDSVAQGERGRSRNQAESYNNLLKSYRRHSNSLSMQLDWANDDDLDESSTPASPTPVATATPSHKANANAASPIRSRRRVISASASDTFSHLLATQGLSDPPFSHQYDDGTPVAVLANNSALNDAATVVESGYELLIDTSQSSSHSASEISDTDGGTGTKSSQAHGRISSGFTFKQLTIIQNEKGLDEQDFRCRSCERSLAPGSAAVAKRRLDFFDGYSYCYACHVNDCCLIPSRILNCWDLKAYPVARGTKRLFERHARRTLIDLGDRAERLAELVAPFRRIEQLRVQLFYLRAYLFTCRANVAEGFRQLAGHREYLFDRVRVYSVADLFDAAAGRLESQLIELVRFGETHVATCGLCRERGFVCEICKRDEVIFPFQRSRTEICARCRGVFHSECKLASASRPCPRCRRKEERERLLHVAQLGANDMPPARRHDDELDFLL